MNKERAEQIIEQVEEDGHEARLYEDYSGKGEAHEKGHSMTLEVRNEAELREAAKRSQDGDVTIIVHDLEMRDTITFPKSDNTVRLLSGSPGGFTTIRQTMRPLLDWRRANGIEVRCRRLFANGLTIRDFNGSGSAIRNLGADELVLTDCLFYGIGRTQWDARVPDPQTAADVVYCSVVASQDVNVARVWLVGCHFRECIHNEHTWSHCLYGSAQDFWVVNCTFDGCGHPFALGAHGGHVSIIANAVTNPAKQFHRKWGRPVAPYLLGFGPASMEFRHNTVEGEYWIPMRGAMNNLVHDVDCNNCSGMTIIDKIGRDRANYIHTWDEWLSFGFDRNSAAPTMGPSVPG